MKKKISHSQYSIWKKCPKQWKIRYIDKVYDDEESIEPAFGTAIHNTIQTWLKTLFYINEYEAEKIDFGTELRKHLVTEIQERSTNKDGIKTAICTKEEFIDIYISGLEILTEFKSRYKEFFNRDEYELIGVEIPVDYEFDIPVEFVGFLDIVLRKKDDGKIYIFDLKTSKKGWSYYQKNDKIKLAQLLFYVNFYSKKMNIDTSDIIPIFIILQRHTTEIVHGNPRRISMFEPSHGKFALKSARKEIEEFLNECFDLDGNYREIEYKANPSPSNCKFCPFRNRKDLCAVGITE